MTTVEVGDDALTTHWNYRVLLRSQWTGVPGADPEEYAEIVEVYYVEDVIEGWSADASAPMGDTVESLRADLTKMLEALDKPALVQDGDKLVEVSE